MASQLMAAQMKWSAAWKLEWIDGVLPQVLLLLTIAGGIDNKIVTWAEEFVPAKSVR